MSAWTCRSSNGNADPKIVPPLPRIPCWKGLGADSEEKHEPVSDIDTVLVDSLKALDPEWPIREAWAMQIARRRGMKKAIVALARRLAVIMHRIWVDGTEFRWTREQAAAAA
jgi:hypothetical protein